MNPRRRFLSFALAAAFLLPPLSALAPRASAQVAAQPQATTPALADTDARLAAVERAIDERRRELGVPGVALVVVKDDRVIYMKGLGYKDFEHKLPVTPDTLFAIGSSSKAFTAMLAAIAADDGKLSLDDPPRKFLPYFRLQDPEADSRITVRDLLSHASGLNRTDLAWITGALDREEVIRVAATAKPTAKLREKFQYQNVMYSAAGECVARAEGTTWEKLIRERIFKPLGMKATTTNVPDMHRAPDYSLGYVYDDDTKETRQLPTRNFPQVAAAGAINSNARDMAQWLRLMLGGGAFEGRRLVSEKSFAELLKPQMKVAGNVDYGLGWFLRDWHGHKVAEHGGNIDGFNAQVALMPDQRLGFVLLTNVTASLLPATAMEAVWSNLVGSPEEKSKAADGAAKAADGAPSKIEDEAGNYLLAEANMTMAVAAKDGKLTLSVPGQPTYTLENVGGRRYKLAEVPGFFTTFRPAKDDPKETEIYLEQPQGNFVLKRVRAANNTGAAAEYAGPLKELVGTYEPEKEGANVEVAVREGKVVLVVPGQPAYTLAERSKDVLNLSSLPETYSLLVRRDAAGEVVGVTIKQPEGEFSFKRVAEFKPPLTLDELMSKVVSAAGGEANLRRHKTMLARAEMTFEHQGVGGEATLAASAPDSYSEEVTLTALGKRLGSVHEFFDGARGGEEGTFLPFQPKSGKSLEDARIAADFYAPLDWKANFKTAEIKRTAKVGDEETYVVVFTPEKGNPVTDYYSTKSFLLLRRDTIATQGPVSQPVTETFADYREVGGVFVPFTRVSNTQSFGDIIVKVKEVKFDVALPADAFRQKLTGK